MDTSPAVLMLGYLDFEKLYKKKMLLTQLPLKQNNNYMSDKKLPYFKYIILESSDFSNGKSKELCTQR